MPLKISNMRLDKNRVKLGIYHNTEGLPEFLHREFRRIIPLFKSFVRLVTQIHWYAEHA